MITEKKLLKYGFEISMDPENAHYTIIIDSYTNEKFVINRQVGFDVFYIQHKDCNDIIHFTTQIESVPHLKKLFNAITRKKLKLK